MIYIYIKVNFLPGLIGAASHLSDTSGDLVEELEDDYQQLEGIVESVKKSNRLSRSWGALLLPSL